MVTAHVASLWVGGNGTYLSLGKKEEKLSFLSTSLMRCDERLIL